MSNFNSTIKYFYRHFSETERDQIEVYLAEGLKPAEIARRLRNRSTISREIKRDSVKQFK